MVDAKESTIQDHLSANYLPYSQFENTYVFDHIENKDSYTRTVTRTGILSQGSCHLICACQKVRFLNTLKYNTKREMLHK